MSNKLAGFILALASRHKPYHLLLLLITDQVMLQQCVMLARWRLHLGNMLAAPRHNFHTSHNGGLWRKGADSLQPLQAPGEPKQLASLPVDHISLHIDLN